MKVTLLAGFLLVWLASSCASSFQGIRFRAQAPPIEEAFRKLSLAITLDGYEASRVDPSGFHIETLWRPLKEKEKSDADVKGGIQGVEARLTLRIERRGLLYDVFLVPSLRYGTAEGSFREAIAGVHHPLWEKWQRVLRATLEREAKEED